MTRGSTLFSTCRLLMLQILFFSFLALGANAQIVINELSYNPCGTQGSDNDCEFIELLNTGTTAVDISGFSLDDPTFVFPTGTNMAAGEFILVVFNSTNIGSCAYTNAIPGGTQIFQWTGGNLGNSGESVQLLDASSAIIDAFVYDDGPCGADGDCNSLQYSGTGDNSSCPTNWSADEPTPGADNNGGGGGGGVCAITNVVATASTCNGDNAEFSVNFTATDASGNYNVIAASAAYGFAVGDVIASGTASPISITITGPTTAGTLDVNVEDAADPNCAGIATTATITTCPTVMCAISNATATTTCNPFGGFDLDICFDYVDALGPNVVVEVNSQILGTFAYPAVSGGCIQVQNIPSNSSEWSCDGTQGSVSIEIYDENTTFEGVPFMSEIHYDDVGGDNNEFIEITAGAGVDLTGYSIELYNGNGGVLYNTIPLSGIIADEGIGCGTLSFPATGIQNGAPDGFALVDPTGTVLEFLSYEGSFMATSGAATGITSTDILVEETGGTDENSSIELTDTGWAVVLVASPGVLNANITSCLTPVCATTVTVTEEDCCPAPKADCGSCTYFLYLYDSVGDGWDGGRLIVSVNEDEATEYKLTPTDGLSQFYPITINDGGLIEIMYMNGANTNQHAYQLFDETGASVFADGVPYTGASPVAGVNEIIKAECAACCQEEDTYTVAITMGSSPEIISWDLTDGFGDRVAFANAGDYLGLSAGAVQTQTVTLEGCNDYRFNAFSADNGGWNGATWEIYSTDPARGTLITTGQFQGQYLVSSGPCMFGEETTTLFTLPCQTECPADETVVADDLATCSTTTYTAPTVTPFVCYPNQCHATTMTTTVSYITAVGGAVTGPQGTTSAALPVGVNPVVFETTYADGQIIRCTMLVNVVAEANPSLTCNDNVIISLAPVSSINNCAVVVTPDMVLEDTGLCEDQFTVVVFDENGNALGNEVTSAEAGQTLTYTVQQIGANANLCWGTLSVEDKFNPTIVCQDYTIACNHPQALNENWTNSETFVANAADLPANIAGGTASDPSETIVSIAGECAPLGEIIQDINIGISLNHNDLEDLEISAIAPDGTVFILMNYGTCNNLGVSNLSVNFDSEAGPSINGGCSFDNPGINGAYEPVDALSALYGQPYSDYEGVWQIIVRDNDATANEGIGYGEVTFAQVQIRSGFPTPYSAFDCTLDQVSLLEEAIEETNCDQSEWIGATIVRTWQAVDAFGNSSTCLQTVSLQAPTFDAISLPGDVQLECGQVADTPSLSDTGIPTFDCFDVTDDHHNICDITYTYEDLVLETCGLGKKIIRTWTIVNWCAGVNQTHEQTIKIEDTTGPTIVAENITMNTNEYDCLTSVTFDGAITDACSDIAQVTATYTEGGGVYNQSGTLIIIDITNGASIDNLPLGMTEVVITAQDGCGNQTIENISIDVTDTGAPIAICDDELHVSLGADGTARIYAADFDEGSYDNCSDVTLLINNNDLFFSRDYYEVDCGDIGTVTLYLEVTDAAGNKNTCWAEVLVEDALTPIITGPADITITCDDPAVHDPFGEAEAIDNCNVDIDFVDSGELDQCKAGTLTRTWTATDGSDKSADVTVTQRVTVTHVSDFVVQFPADVTLTDCALQDAGEPSISDDDCELLAISSEDLVLNIVDDACFKIERTWTIINWCVYEEGQAATDLGVPQPLPRTYRDDDGYFTYVQTIKVLDSGAPVITNPGDQSFCDLTDGCEGNADLTIEATDACSPSEALEYTYKIDAFNDGTFDINGEGNDASGVYPYGTHAIKWIVEDGCGNTAAESYLFTVEDCKNPTPVCLNGVSIENMQTGCVDIWASDLLEYAFDNCTDAATVEGSVRMRREGDITSPTSSLTLCCEDVGTVIVEIWVEDEAGNADYCTTYIVVQDNLGNCDDNGGTDESKTISGTLETEAGQPIDQVTMTLSGSTDATIVADGAYAFTGLNANGTYEVNAAKDIDPLNGVSTYDLVLISQYILGQNQLDSPHKLIAADINNDGNISTFDVVQLRQLILFIIQDLPSNTSWRFVSADYIFPNPTNPWIEAFPEMESLEAGDIADFVGVKIGDVNGDATANANVVEDRNKSGVLNLNMDDAAFEKGANIEVAFKASDFNNVNGFQFTLNTNGLTYTNVEAGALNITEGNFGFTMLSEGVITASWNSNDVMTLDNDEVLFTMNFMASETLVLSESLAVNSRYTNAEAYSNTEILDIALNFQTEATTTSDVVLYQNTPNPFKGETNIGFDLPEATSATIKVYDVTGKTIQMIEGDFVKGYNQITVKDLNAVGVLYYQIDTPNHSVTKKMIVLE